MLLWYLQDKGVSSTKVINLRKILFYSALCIPVILLLISLAGIYKRTGSIENRIITENTANSEQIEIIKKNLIQMSSDINQTRNLVGLPESDYSFDDNDEKSDDKSNSPDSNNTVYYKSFEFLINHFKEVELLKKLSAIIDSKTFINAVEKNYLHILEKDNSYILADIKSNSEIFRFYADNSENAAVLEPPFENLSKGIFTSFSPDETAAFLTDNTPAVIKQYSILNKNIDAMKNILNDYSVKTYLSQKKLYLDNFTSGNESTSINIKRESGIKIAGIILNHSSNIFNFCGKDYNTFQSLKNDLLKINQICDIRTFDEKRIDQSKKDLEMLTSDESFTSYLSDKGFLFSDMIREDSDYFYYDILSKNRNSIIGSFAVHKVSGEIYLTDHEEIPLSSINRFSSISKKKN